MTNELDPRLEDRIRTVLHERAEELPEPEDHLPAVSAGTHDGSFESFYADTRGPVFRALVLTLRDRDVATEAVDRAFGKLYARWRSVKRSAHPAAELFTAAYAWATRGGRDRRGEVTGFRLEREQFDEADRRLVTAFAELPVADRALLVTHHYLGWDDTEAARAVGIPDSGLAGRLHRVEASLASSEGVAPDVISARLRRVLRREAADLTEPLSRLEAARGQGWARRIGVVLGSAAAVLVLVGGAALGYRIITADETPDDGSIVALTPDKGRSIVPDPGTGTVQPITEVEWAQVPLPLREGEASAVAWADPGFLAFAQDYSGGGMLAFRSPDGVEWEQVSAPLQGNQGWIHQLIGGDFGFLAIGNTFDERNGRDSPGIWFSQDGETWAGAALPLPERITIEGVGDFRLYSWVNQIAATGDGFFAIGNENIEWDRDPMQFFADKLPEDVSLNDHGWGTSGTGLQVYGAQGQVVFEATWEELGVDPEFAQYFGSGKTTLWRSEDGIAWERLESSFSFGSDAWVNGMVATESGMAALVHGRFGAAVWTSTDGETWERAEIPGATGIQHMAGSGDTIFVAGSSNDGQAAVWSSTDGTTWTQSSSDLGAGSIERLVASPQGLLALVNAAAQAQMVGPVELEVDGHTVSISQLGSYTVERPDGTTFDASEDELAFTGSAVEITDPDNEIVLTVSQREIDMAWEQAYREIEFEGRQFEGPQYDLAVSGDGATWTVIPMTEEIGTGFYPNHLALGESAIVMSGWQEQGGFPGVGGGPPPPSLWVATLPE